MWGSGTVEDQCHSYRSLLSRPPEEGNMVRLDNYSWHAEWKKMWCDDDDEGGSGVCGAFIFLGFTRTLILCSFTDSDMPGNKVCHAGQGCGQALALASRAWVSGQERWHVITMPKDALLLEGHCLWGDFPMPASSLRQFYHSRIKQGFHTCASGLVLAMNGKWNISKERKSAIKESSGSRVRTGRC